MTKIIIKKKKKRKYDWILEKEYLFQKKIEGVMKIIMSYIICWFREQ